MHQDEDEQADPQQQGGYREKLEVGAHCVFDEGDEGVVRLEDVTGVDEGDFHAHLSVTIILNIIFYWEHQFGCHLRQNKNNSALGLSIQNLVYSAILASK